MAKRKTMIQNDLRLELIENLNKIYYKNLKIKIKNAKSIGNYFTDDEVEFLIQLVENNQNVELKTRENG